MTATHGSAEEWQRFASLMVREGEWRSEAVLDRYLRFLFAGVRLAGRRVLDLGGGAGVMSCYAALRGAAEVVCVEPEAAGSTDGVRERFRRFAGELGLENTTLIAAPIQEYEPPGRFDVVLLHNSVNHLDEPACIALRRDAEARATYRGLFERLGGLSAAGADLVIADCTPLNLFPLLGLPHPVARTIEWHKHQPPGLWSALLADVGFAYPEVTWSSFNRLGRLGWLVLANRLGAFVFTGHFRLRMRRLS